MYLVGASGAGKTTVAAIAAGVLMPTAGTVRLGGVDIKALGEARTQQQVALLSQEVHVFSGALLEDIRLAKASATVEEVEAALELVGALGSRRIGSSYWTTGAWWSQVRMLSCWL